MSECTSALIALAIITLILLVIYLGVSYAFEILENRSLREEINNGFHHTVGFNESLAKDNKFLEDELRPYKRLANKYCCQDADDLEKLLLDIQDKLNLFEYKECCHQKRKRCLAMAKWCDASMAYFGEFYDSASEQMVAHYYKWHKRWLELAEKFKEAK